VSGRVRYGVDGWPYLAGLTTAAVVLVPAGLVVGGVLGVVLLLVGLAAAVPAALGWRYVLHGKARLRDRLLDAVPWRGDEAVVDLGCGSGLLALGAAQRTTGTVSAVDRWVGKDLSGNGPDRLRRNAEILGVTGGVEVLTADVRDLPLPDASVDVVVSALCLHNLPEPADRRRALEEALRVLRPGGRLLVSDLAHVDDEYAPQLREHGLQVTTQRVPATFPPQRMLVARAD
jgi:arsenite methyltransferase